MMLYLLPFLSNQTKVHIVSDCCGTPFGYTANLNNFLIQKGMPSGIENMKDAIQQNVPVCVLRNKIPILDSTNGKDKIKYAISPVNDLPGFFDREELFPAMGNGTCVCAVASDEELTILHSEGCIVTPTELVIPSLNCHGDYRSPKNMSNH